MNTFGQYLGLCSRADERCDRVLDFSRRLDDGLAVGDECLLETRILHPNVIANTAVIQERPDERRTDGIADAV